MSDNANKYRKQRAAILWRMFHHAFWKHIPSPAFDVAIKFRYRWVPHLAVHDTPPDVYGGHVSHRQGTLIYTCTHECFVFPLGRFLWVPRSWITLNKSIKNNSPVISARLCRLMKDAIDTDGCPVEGCHGVGKEYQTAASDEKTWRWALPVGFTCFRFRFGVTRTREMRGMRGSF